MPIRINYDREKKQKKWEKKKHVERGERKTFAASCMMCVDNKDDFSYAVVGFSFVLYGWTFFQRRQNN